jgi:hypothetical protein
VLVFMVGEEVGRKGSRIDLNKDGWTDLRGGESLLV